MRIRFFKALWGMEGPLGPNLARIASAGYAGFEAPMFSFGPAEMAAGANEHGLAYIGQFFPLTADDLKEGLDKTVAAGGRMMNLHTGKDWWPFERGAALFEAALRLQESSPIPIVHETHRGRLLFSPGATARYLREFPELRITADFSHFTCVCESLLEDQAEDLAVCMDRSVYVHARVGHEEGPQIPDPRAPEWTRHVERFSSWWDAILERRRTSGATETLVTPEFGPPGYMWTQPYTGMPVADLWDVCLAMRDRLAARWSC